jgi:hypothetical protein
VGARLVAVDVLAHALGRGSVATSVVDNGDALVVADKGRLREIRKAAGPGDGSRGGVGASSNPGAELDLHGRLGERAAALGILVRQGSHHGAVDDPLHGRGRPLDRVDVELANGVLDGVERAAVVRRCVALAEVVGLDLGVVTSEPLPIDLGTIQRQLMNPRGKE